MKTKLMALESISRFIGALGVMVNDPDSDGDIVFGREVVAALEADIAKPVEPVGAESRFTESSAWLRCSVEHHNLVSAKPDEWPGYETRLLYTTPQYPAAAELLKTLIEAREALQFANDSPKGPICDTIWMMHRPETLFDFLDVAIENATAAPGGAA